MIELNFSGLGLTYTNALICVGLVAAMLLSLRRTDPGELLPVDASQELKGLAILSIVFAHISYMLVTEKQYLYPLSIAAGVGVDIFLCMSGYGLTVGMLKRRQAPLEFYRRRLIKVFIPLWVALLILFAADALFLQRYYSPLYMLQSLLGWFPRADSVADVNSPFWYISWLLLFYVLFPLLFMPSRPWLTALLLAAIANVLAIFDPLRLQVDWLHHLHTNAFSLGILLAWLLHEVPGTRNALAERVRLSRAQASIPHVVLVIALLAGAGYLTAHHATTQWPRSAHLLSDAGFRADDFLEQSASLLALLALVGVAMLKRVESRFLHLFGVYSFETYLLHWPLLSRYDVFFRHLQPWLAPFAWLLAFIGAGWLLQRITTPIGQWFDRRS
jgi:peptidoglycan/LPS O-acetylase OafA/YrhL